MPEHRMNEYYRERAGEYEQIYHRDDPARQAELAAERERLTELVEGRDVLELACGSGYWTAVMSCAAHSLTATDIEPAMITVAKAKSYPIEVSFRRADMFADKFEPVYDIVALGFWFSHQPRQEYERLFDILCAPLRRGGRIWMIDNNPPAEGPTNDSIGVDEHGNNFKTRRLSDGREFVILKNYFQPEELRRILEPRFEVERLVFGYRYWSTVLRPL